jgi:hypothetical protein
MFGSSDGMYTSALNFNSASCNPYLNDTTDCNAKAVWSDDNATTVTLGSIGVVDMRLTSMGNCIALTNATSGMLEGFSCDDANAIYHSACEFSCASGKNRQGKARALLQ